MGPYLYESNPKQTNIAGKARNEIVMKRPKKGIKKISLVGNEVVMKNTMNTMKSSW